MHVLVVVGLIMLIFFQGNSIDSDDLDPNDSKEKTTRVQNLIGALFFTVINQTMMGIMSLMAAFPTERAVFLREQAN